MTDPDLEHVCDGCDSCAATTLVADAGARVIAAHAGVPTERYDALGPHVRDHYRLIASEVMAAMSEALIDLGVVTPTPPQEGTTP